MEKLCRENGIEFLGVFGSTVRGENCSDSDVGLLVRFKPTTKIGFFEWFDIERRFSEKLGKKADLVIQDALNACELAGKWGTDICRRECSKHQGFSFTVFRFVPGFVGSI